MVARWRPKLLSRLLGALELKTPLSALSRREKATVPQQSVLQFIHSLIAMGVLLLNCPVIRRRTSQACCTLLRDIADDRVLPWIADMKEDRSEDVQFWGFLTHEVLYDRGHLDLTQLEGHIKEGLDHRSPGVRQAARQINSRFVQCWTSLMQSNASVKNAPFGRWAAQRRAAPYLSH